MFEVDAFVVLDSEASVVGLEKPLTGDALHRCMDVHELGHKCPLHWRAGSSCTGQAQSHSNVGPLGVPRSASGALARPGQDSDGSHALPEAADLRRRLPTAPRRRQARLSRRQQNAKVRIREGTAGRHSHPARSTLTRTSTLRISHFPDPYPRRYAAHQQPERASPADPSRPPVDNRGEPDRRSPQAIHDSGGPTTGRRRLPATAPNAAGSNGVSGPSPDRY